MPQIDDALFLRSLLRLKGGRTGGVGQPGAAHAVPGLSAAQKALLMRYSSTDRPTVYLVIAD